MLSKQELIKDVMFKYGLGETAAAEFVNRELQDLKKIVEGAEKQRVLLKQRMKG